MKDPLDNALKGLNTAVAEIAKQIEKLKCERGVAMPIPHPIQSGIFGNKELEYHTDLNHYHWNFPYKFNDTESNITHALTAAMAKLDAVERLADQLHAANVPIIENNTRVRAYMIDFMTSFGMITYRYREIKVGRGKTRSEETTAYWVDEVNKLAPINDNYQSFKNALASTRKRIQEQAKTKLDAIKSAERAAQRHEEEQREKATKLVKALDYCQEHIISTVDLSNDQLIELWEDKIYGHQDDD